MFWKDPSHVARMRSDAPLTTNADHDNPDREHLASITRRLDLIERLLREIDTLSDEEWLGRQEDFLRTMQLGRERKKDPVRMPSDGAPVAGTLS